MAEANYTGGSIAKSAEANENGFFPGVQVLPERLLIPKRIPATPGVARGGKGKRLTPTPAPQVSLTVSTVARIMLKNLDWFWQYRYQSTCARQVPDRGTTYGDGGTTQGGVEGSRGSIRGR